MVQLQEAAEWDHREHDIKTRRLGRHLRRRIDWIALPLHSHTLGPSSVLAIHSAHTHTASSALASLESRTNSSRFPQIYIFFPSFPPKTQIDNTRTDSDLPQGLVARVGFRRRHRCMLHLSPPINLPGSLSLQSRSLSSHSHLRPLTAAFCRFPTSNLDPNRVHSPRLLSTHTRIRTFASDPPPHFISSHIFARQDEHQQAQCEAQLAQGSRQASGNVSRLHLTPVPPPFGCLHASRKASH